VLRGSDPKLRNEHVVYSAHLDHMGIGAPVDGDSIYNGARDNASGIAALLEIARSFMRLPQPPRRSIMFVAVTGEESGLVGSDYFAHYPTVPISAMAANVNMDELAIDYDFRDVVALGEDHSTLGKFVRASGATDGSGSHARPGAGAETFHPQRPILLCAPGCALDLTE